MSKQTKPKEEPRRVGPKFARNNVIPENFQIRRPASPMADLLDEASGFVRHETPENQQKEITPVKSTPVKSTGVDFTGVRASHHLNIDGERGVLPVLEDFVDRILPRFPPARQAILIRLYRWCEGQEREVVVSTPRLAAHTNMDEKSCRTHLHALIAEGFLVRAMDGEQIAKFGGNDRAARGLILKISSRALRELIT